jgi:hypothetical protein
MHLALLALALGASQPEPGRVRTSALWFELGHRIVARIAEAHLTPRTAKAVQDLLAGSTLADVSSWADAIRVARRETAPLHFVNIPLEADDYDRKRDCPSGRCVIAAIEKNRKILGNASLSRRERSTALKFLVHLLADLHQPLHVASNQDRGGTRTQVRFSGRGSNLHQVWDGELIEARWPDQDAYFEHLREEMNALDFGRLERGTVVDWALEGHQLARSAYRIPRDRRLEADYVDTHLPEVDLALIKAGVRLARILNEALGRI